MQERQAGICKAKGRRRMKQSHRAGNFGKIMTERRKVRRLTKYLSAHSEDKQAYKAFIRWGGNINKLNLKPVEKVEVELPVLSPSVKFAKWHKGMKQKTTQQLRDFHASWLTLSQLYAGIRKARNNYYNTHNAMYSDQIDAYKSRILYYEKG